MMWEALDTDHSFSQKPSTPGRSCAAAASQCGVLMLRFMLKEGSTYFTLTNSIPWLPEKMKKFNLLCIYYSKQWVQSNTHSL